MPIPGTDIETTGELAGRLIREGREDTLAAADRARRAEVECERLRGLLAIARNAVQQAAIRFREAPQPRMALAAALDEAWHRSAPAATPEEAP